MLQKKAKDLTTFIYEIVKDIVEDEVLTNRSSIFIAKKNVIRDQKLKQNRNADH